MQEKAPDGKNYTSPWPFPSGNAMKPDDYANLSPEEKERHLAANRLEHDRKETLRIVNEMFAERARMAAAGEVMDQTKAQHFVHIAQDAAHRAAGYETVSLAFSHDAPESRDALKLFLQMFRRSVSPIAWHDTISCVTIDRWLYGLDLLSHGIALPALETTKTKGPKTKQKVDARNIAISFWYAYMTGLHPHNATDAICAQLATYFGLHKNNIQKHISFAVEQFGMTEGIEYYRNEGRNLQWPRDLAGGDNPAIQEAFTASQNARWAEMGDEWEGYLASGESELEWRKILARAVDIHLEGQWKSG